ncbi:MAG: YbhB/YbcL family Raf kinase inhibitor-like protein [Calditrichia bacterium]
MFTFNVKMILLLLIMLVAGCNSQDQKQSPKQVEEKQMESFYLKADAFHEGDMIPVKFTCQGEDVSPQLQWGHVPEGTESFALICDDPDAPMGTWVHWVVYNIPADYTGFTEGMGNKQELPDGIQQGVNDFGNTNYGGPCPPPGAPHRYYFKLYALDTLTDFKAGLTKSELLNQIESHIIAKTELMGKYRRK